MLNVCVKQNLCNLVQRLCWAVPFCVSGPPPELHLLLIDKDQLNSDRPYWPALYSTRKPLHMQKPYNIFEIILKKVLKLVFLSFLAFLDIWDLIHLNLINHLLKSDLGEGKKNWASVLPVLADMRQLFAVPFIISGSSGLRREGALGKRAVVQFLLST